MFGGEGAGPGSCARLHQVLLKPQAATFDVGLCQPSTVREGSGRCSLNRLQPISIARVTHSPHTGRHSSHETLRHFLASTLAPAAFCTLGTTGCQPSTSLRDLSFAPLSEAQHDLDRRASLADRAQTAAWTWPATLTHCAQSIRFALAGYPQTKSELFQRTVGRAAYQVFAWRGQMNHDLGEPIPGAPALSPQADPKVALTELHQAIDAFHGHTDDLQPHFAYGRLSKAEYELAHAMHLANHLADFDVSPAA